MNLILAEKTGVVFGSFNIILFVIFLTLKLFNVIDWSWAYVTAPLWISAAVLIGIIILLVVFFLILLLIESIREVFIDKKYGN